MNYEDLYFDLLSITWFSLERNCVVNVNKVLCVFVASDSRYMRFEFGLLATRKLTKWQPWAWHVTWGRHENVVSAPLLLLFLFLHLLMGSVNVLSFLTFQSLRIFEALEGLIHWKWKLSIQSRHRRSHWQITGWRIGLFESFWVLTWHDKIIIINYNCSSVSLNHLVYSLNGFGVGTLSQTGLLANMRILLKAWCILRLIQNTV